MDKAQRAELLRQRFKAIAGPYATRQPAKAKAKRYVPTRTPYRFTYPMGFAGGHGIVGQWVVAADAKPELTVEPCKRRKGKAALTLIAEKWGSRHEGKPAGIGRGFRPPRSRSSEVAAAYPDR